VAAGQVQLPQQQATHGQPVRLAPRSAVLAGREELLANLDALLAGGDGPGPRRVTLFGLGGAGKTSVAVEYAYRHLAEAGVVWQFPAEDPAVLVAGFGELAAQLGARGVGDTRGPVASVHTVLARLAAGWLLIFDNAADLASVAEYLPPAGPGRVLITSRNPNWPGQTLDVPVLDIDVAAAFLVSRTGDRDGPAAAGELAGELGGLPLALEQAAAYIQATAGSLAGYLGLFRQHQDQLLARGEPTGYAKTVATTWSLALRQLEESAPTAAGLLRLLACLAPEPVPMTLLFADTQVADELVPEVAVAVGPLLGNAIATGDVVAALRRYSLITPAGDGMMLMHRLVQHVTRAQSPTYVVAQWKQAAATLVEAAIPTDTRLPAAWSACAVLLPHARAVLDLTSGGMQQIATYLGRSGSYPAARDLFQLIAYAFTEDDAYGPEHPDTLAVRADLASWTGMAGDAAAARDQYAALLPVVERALGPEHPDALACRSSLARFTWDAGDAAGARDQFAALLPIAERALGPEHPDTLHTRRNLARWTGGAGDAAGARDQLVALLPIAERALGPEHPDTLTTRRNLARWTGAAGDAAGARDQLAALLPMHEQILGPEHPDTLTTRGNLAYWTGRAGDAAAARDRYTALLPIIEQVLGPEHPRTLAARKNLTFWTREAEDDPASGVD
jgi:hypothetical protein